MKGQHLLGDAAACSLLCSTQGEAKQSSIEIAPGVAAKGLVGRELVWVGIRRAGLHKIDALAWVLRRDVWQVVAVWIKNDKLAPWRDTYP